MVGEILPAGTEAVGRAVKELRGSSKPWVGWEGYQVFHLSYFVLLTTLDMFLIVFLVYIVDYQTIIVNDYVYIINICSKTLAPSW